MKLEQEINHILDSGANSIRLIELFERYAKRAYEVGYVRRGWEEGVAGVPWKPAPDFQEWLDKQK